MSKAKAKNLVRFDLSSHLIHFVRPMRIHERDCFWPSEEWGWDNPAGMEDISPYFLLRCIIRKGRIWATWSVRGGQRTVYGPSPAVCFTEMPLAAFVQTSEARAARGEKVSSYGILLPKVAMFKAGARPVVYGLSGRAIATTTDDGCRMLPSKKLAPEEQFRYVAYDPRQANGPDWTHEREWRWPYRPDKAAAGESTNLWCQPALELYSFGVEGIGAIVRSDLQATLLVHDIIRLIDLQRISSRTFGFILTLENLPPLEELWRPENVHVALQENLVDLQRYLVAPPNARSLVERFFGHVTALAQESHCPTQVHVGDSWLWLYDNTHPLVRSLCKAGHITITKAGRYLVSLPQFSLEFGVLRKEEFIKALAVRVRREFGAACGYFTVNYSYDPDDIPFYHDFVDEREERIFLNECWHKSDY